MTTSTPDISAKMARYNLTQADVLHENGHAFVDMKKLGLSLSAKSCLHCGLMRNRDGDNKACRGNVKVGLR